MNNSMKRLSGWLWPALAAVAVAWPIAGHAQAGDVDPDALALLRRSTDYLAATKQFSLVTDTTIEAVLADGQKLQFGHRVAVTVQRPNKMRAERIGELITQTFYYDGKTLSLNLPAAEVLRDGGRSAHARRHARCRARQAQRHRARRRPGLRERVRAFDRRPDLGLHRRRGRRRRGALRPHRVPQCRGRLADLDPAGRQAGAAQVRHHLETNARVAAVRLGHVELADRARRSPMPPSVSCRRRVRRRSTSCRWHRPCRNK